MRERTNVSVPSTSWPDVFPMHGSSCVAGAHVGAHLAVTLAAFVPVLYMFFPSRIRALSVIIVFAFLGRFFHTFEPITPLRTRGRPSVPVALGLAQGPEEVGWQRRLSVCVWEEGLGFSAGLVLLAVGMTEFCAQFQGARTYAQASTCQSCMLCFRLIPDSRLTR